MQLLLEDLLMTESSIELLVPNDHSHTHYALLFHICLASVCDHFVSPSVSLYSFGTIG